MRYDAILMDADDTLFDFRLAERNAIGEVLARLDVRDADAPAVYHRINRACWEAFERGEMTQETLRVKRFDDLLTHYGLRADAAEAALAFTRALARQSALLPGALEAARAIAARLPVAIVTNGLGEVQRGRMNASPLRSCVSAMIISGEHGFQKPDPRLLFAALDALGGIAPERALMVGDSLTSDILAANRAGVDACWYNPAGKPLPEGYRARYDIRDIGEAVRIALQE